MSSDLIKHVTGASFDAEVLKAEGAVLVSYWAESDGPSKVIAPVFLIGTAVGASQEKDG